MTRLEPMAEGTESLLAAADPRSLAATLVYLSDDPSLEVDPRDKEGLATLATEVLPQFVGQHVADLAERNTATFRRSMALAVGQELPDGYEELVRSYFRLSPTAYRANRPPIGPTNATVTIIGGGVTGILVARALEAAGFSNFHILDKHPEPGGVWWQNTYPGCRVDTPSLIYSYSFDPDPGWMDHFSYQPEVLRYLSRHAAPFSDRYRPGVEVLSLTWEKGADEWIIGCRSVHSGDTYTVRSNFVVAATGILGIPRLPDIPGRDEFRGPSFHSSRWDHSVEIRGKRVAIIGTGASSNQIAPAIADIAGEVLVFQRSPHWVVAHPRHGAPLDQSERLLLAQVPSYSEWYRFRQFWTLGDAALDSIRIDPTWEHHDQSANAANEQFRQKLVAYIESKLRHLPEVMKAVTPNYPPYTKRILLDNGWYDALAREDVRLVSSPILRITESGIETKAGLIPADVIVFATGFQTDRYLGEVPIRGANQFDVREHLDNSGDSYLGVLVPKAPNFFLTWGPYSVPGHGGSGTFIAECQADYIVECLRLVVDTGSRNLVVKDSTVADFISDMRASLERLVWSLNDETNWYRRSDGRVVALPRRVFELWSDTRRVAEGTVTLG